MDKGKKTSYGDGSSSFDNLIRLALRVLETARDDRPGKGKM